ncbi:MAG: YtxH domain-containing protein, partial [Parasporobacterium sp.]|nr:YtxH domain-containing protein [Parasporobacterium sp.]
MKKSLIMVLALCVAAAMLLSACGQAKKPEATTVPESAAEEVSEAVSEAVEEVTEAVSEVVEEVTDAAEEAKEEASEAVSEAAEEVTEAISEVAEEVTDAAEEVKEEASEIAEEITDAAEEVKEEAADAAEDVKEEASEAVEEVKEEVSDTAEEVKEEASEVVEEVKEEAVDTAEEVKEEAASVVEDAKDKTEEVVEDVKDKAEEVKEDAAAVVEDAKDKVEEIVEDVTAEAEEAAEEAVEETSELTAPMTYAEYAAAEIDDEVFVEAYVQNHQSWWEDKITVYAADEDGAYFIYEMACSEEDAAKLVPGTKILVRGYKAEWSGEVEIADATFEFAEEDGEGYIAEAEDITELLGKDELIDHMNEFVSFKGLTIEPSKDADEKEAPFLYNWDGSGTQGDDLYFNASVNGETFTFTVESYLCDKDTDVYKAVEAL